MATRIEIELTSRRDDDTFTWRAAGAREPKGVADVSLFPEGSSVGEQFRVDADFDLDGITVTNVLPKEEKKRSAFDTLELLARDDEPLVTQQLAEGGRRGERRDRGERGRDKRRGGRKEGGDRGERREGRPRSGSDRPRTPPKPKLPPKPKPPRLKAGRHHRDELLASLPEEQKPVAQELLRGGLQAVRTALAKQNEQQRTEGAPEIDEGPIIALAEELLVRVRTAEWRDRAEAALEQADAVDLRDLRTVVTAADGMGRDEETRALGSKLRAALNERLDAEHHAWVNEIIELLEDDRVVRALHLSSRPPKAGAPLPAPVAMRLVEAANAAMTADVAPDRWGYILEALAHSPVRRQVVPASLPATVPDELKTTISRFGQQLPEIAEIFGVEPDPRAGRGGERRRRRPKGRKDGEQKGGGTQAKAGEQNGRGAQAKAEQGRADRSGAEQPATDPAHAEQREDQSPPEEPQPAPMADRASTEAAPAAGDQPDAAAPDRADAPSDVEVDARADASADAGHAAEAGDSADTGDEAEPANRVPAGGPPAEGDPADATTPPPGGGISADEPAAEG